MFLVDSRQTSSLQRIDNKVNAWDLSSASQAYYCCRLLYVLDSEILITSGTDIMHSTSTLRHHFEASGARGIWNRQSYQSFFQR